MTSSLLIVGNDPATAELLQPALEKYGFDIRLAPSGRQALVQVHRSAPEVILIDVAALRSNARRLSHALRGEGYTYIVFLTASARADSTGADLALLKATPPKKLAQKIKSSFDHRPPHTVQVGGLILDLEKRKVARGTKSFPLTPKEFGLLKLFMEHKGQVVSRKDLMKEVWETDYLGDTRTLDVHIRWLREKIEENAARPKRLVTRRKVGYVLNAK